MPAPAVVFGFILATLYGSGLHFLVGGDARRLALLLLVSWIGFALGQIMGDLLAFEAGKIGMLYFCPASLGAGIALALVLTLARRERA